MKVRKFYPSQVLLRLAGRHLRQLDKAHRAALHIGMHRSRKLNIVFTIADGNVSVYRSPDQLMKAHHASITTQDDFPLADSGELPYLASGQYPRA